MTNESQSNDEDFSAVDYEKNHVHEVYQSIAHHFSQTRYKPWPIVNEFLKNQPMGSIGLDVGSGNGKYLHGHNLTFNSQSSTNSEIPIGAKDPQSLLNEESRYLLIGLDRSISLLSLSSNHQSNPELLNGDCLSLPIRSNFSFDFIISIATLHHLSTFERRSKSIQSLLQLIKPKNRYDKKGKLLIFVWAFEQGQRSNRSFENRKLLPAKSLKDETQIRLENKEDEKKDKIQDVFVPWVTQDPSTSQPVTFNRFYHLFKEGELNDLIHQAATVVGLTHVPQNQLSNVTSVQDSQNTYRILNHGYEADNWWVEVEVG
ncbi:uncharacterized protein MELLADRAFT_76777 [Melampsora larici-populina 98AG31]|uniref:Methyltransferase type 11 domain-containing protein n=1 Tax=Melampsora larici-populina (strain 98AG31 / pathotype 3-4-7) TaxID=747676 RepID=F4R9L2_MELLP|nr:uncharacterized protein MELLADRAFT_76777 [Melampsora larici-populina 98AG31]EGG11000.1 hypothetical protein MELLADRAFT_76777 [Melampsora larici-populina 98AG31]